MSDGKINHDTSEPSTMWLILTVVLTTFFITVVSVFSIYFYQVTRSDELNAKEQTSPRPELMALRDYESNILSSFTWVNKEKGKVRIPVEKAIKQVIKDYQD